MERDWKMSEKVSKIFMKSVQDGNVMEVEIQKIKQSFLTKKRNFTKYIV